MKKLYQVQSLEWFKENAFQDNDGDFWEEEKEKDIWNGTNHSGQDRYCKIIDHEDAGQIITEAYSWYPKSTWAIKYEITKKTHPEHFL